MLMALMIHWWPSEARVTGMTGGAFLRGGDQGVGGSCVEAEARGSDLIQVTTDFALIMWIACISCVTGMALSCKGGSVLYRCGGRG